MWENNGELNKYGTTMGLMLLPFWTKGCIGSMEGLYFEAAGTTPYHFVAAAALSKQSSNPVRELRYDNNNPQLGVKYMRSLGIRYYMAFTPEAVSKAATERELHEVTTTGPWHVYEIADTTLVEYFEVRQHLHALVLDRQGIAVRAGAPSPDAGTVEGLRRLFLSAKSIAYSASVSGQYLTTELIQRLGIADQVLPKRIRRDLSGDGLSAMRIADARTHVHVYLLSELSRSNVEELGIGHVTSPDEIARLCRQYDSCALLGDAQYATVTIAS